MKSLGDIIRAEIQRQGRTAYQLREETGVEASVISRFLNGERDLRLATANKLCEALKLELKLAASVRRKHSQTDAENSRQ